MESRLFMCGIVLKWSHVISEIINIHQKIEILELRNYEIHPELSAHLQNCGLASGKKLFIFIRHSGTFPRLSLGSSLSQ